MDIVQSLFKDSQGAFLIDQPHNFIFVSKEEETDQYGVKQLIVLESLTDNKDYSWKLTQPQYDRIFIDTFPDGNVSWEAKAEEEVEIKVVTTSNGRSCFVGKLSTGGLPPEVAACAEEVTPPAPEAPTEDAPVSVPEPPLTSEPAPAEVDTGVTYDGTFRQKGWRIQLAGIEQAIIESGTFDLKNDKDVAELEALADGMTVSLRERADELERSHPSH